MRNLFNKATGTAIAIAAAAVLSSGSALAFHDTIPGNPPSVGAHVFISFEDCGVYNDDVVLVPIFAKSLGGTATIQAVLTGNGNAKNTCNGLLTGEPLPDKTRVITVEDTLGNDPENFPDGLPCFTAAGATFDWHQVLTKNGRVALTCHVNINQ